MRQSTSGVLVQDAERVDDERRRKVLIEGERTAYDSTIVEHRVFALRGDDSAEVSVRRAGLDHEAPGPHRDVLWVCGEADRERAARQ